MVLGEDSMHNASNRSAIGLQGFWQPMPRNAFVGNFFDLRKDESERMKEFETFTSWIRPEVAASRDGGGVEYR